MTSFIEVCGGGIPSSVRTLPTVDTASGAIATFNTDLTENLVEVKCQIVAQQASGTPSPVNPLLITTYSEMNVTHCGKNIFDGTLVQGGIVGTDGQIDINVTFRCATGFIPVREGDYVASIESGKKIVCFHYYNSSKVSVSGNIAQSAVTIPSGVSYVRIAVGYNDNSNITPSDVTALQVELGNAPTTYTPFTAYNTYNIPFGQTVANGVLDITTGKLRVTWVEFDMGSLTWFYLTSGSSVAPYFYANLSNLKPWSTIIPVLTPIYKTVKRNTSEFIDNTICGELSQIQIKDSRFTDAQSFKSAINGVIAIYELATPIEIQLDSITLQALLNKNNIWCDTGDTEVKFLLTVGKAIS